MIRTPKRTFYKVMKKHVINRLQLHQVFSDNCTLLAYPFLLIFSFLAHLVYQILLTLFHLYRICYAFSVEVFAGFVVNFFVKIY